MPQVMFVELGMGADLRGSDPTKAALRAVRDAIGRNYMPGIRGLLGGDPSRMRVNVRLGLPKAAGPVDEAAVKAALPYGEVTVETVDGGLLTPGHMEGEDSPILVVVAAVEVSV